METILCLARNTFRESIRSKVLYSVLFFAAAVVIVAAVFGRVTIGDQYKVVKDFGLFSISLFSVAYAVISGAALLHKELARKTIYNLLAKPVERRQLLVGKFLGMLATVGALSLLMSTSLVAFLFLLGGEFDGGVLIAVPYILCELAILCAATIFFSSIVVTPLLSGMFTFALFLAGRSSAYLLVFSRDTALGDFGSTAVRAVYEILPHLNDLIVNDQIVYGDYATLTAARLAWSTVYALGYSTLLLTIAVLIFRRREFN